MTHPQREPIDWRRVGRLLPMYFIGVAIGCVLVGLILSLKRTILTPPQPPPPPTQTTTP